MVGIEKFEFAKKAFEKLKGHHFGLNWPVVYVIKGDREIYVGETTSVYSRSKQHFENPARRRLKDLYIITDEEYNKSAALDIESLLIQYIAGEGSYKLQNGNQGLLNHDYYDKERYKAKFDLVWKQLMDTGIVSKTPAEIRNSDLFKYSPYKALTEDQLTVAETLFKEVQKDRGVHIVNGGPGTGKTILATYLVMMLKEREETKHLSVALVVPMVSLRGTIQKVFRSIAGLSSSMVIGPADMGERKYDILIVDEAHRLQQRKNIPNYGQFDKTNKKLGFGNDGTQLDWALKQSRHQILFYDKNQSIKPADLHANSFSKLSATHHQLTSQMRVEGGDEYIEMIADVLEGRPPRSADIENYDFKIYSDIRAMVRDIKSKNDEVGLCRMVAGYAWKWVSRKNSSVNDIEIHGFGLKWNGQIHDWVNSTNAINEVGCIHTIQGYELNYVGVIVGPELSYDPVKEKLFVQPEHYKDSNGWKGISDPSELERYILNIYKTLMTRGIKGCYVYFVDKQVEKYFRNKITDFKLVESAESRGLIKSPITINMLRIPLVGSAPCGNPLLGEENIEEYILVEKSKIKPGFRYFILRAEGDSMNLAGIDDGDLVLCRLQEKAETGDRVVALLGGENVTIKEYGPRINGVRLLMPKSRNKSHAPITPEEGDSVQGVVQEVLESESRE